MGVLPLEFQNGDTAKSLNLTGQESFQIGGLAEQFKPRKTVHVHARDAAGKEKSFSACVRIDTPVEAAYYQHGGILQYVLRQMS
jgi:aconitate hydratase